MEEHGADGETGGNGGLIGRAVVCKGPDGPDNLQHTVGTGRKGKKQHTGVRARQGNRVDQGTCGSQAEQAARMTERNVS